MIEKELSPSCCRSPGRRTLLQHYADAGHYTDCYSTEISKSVSQSQYIAAFYTTFLFKIERFILRWAVSNPSTDAEALQLANAERDTFAAWRVEARDDDQLLLCDYAGRTRSWLMVEKQSGDQTRLYFGSAVVRSQKDENSNTKRGFGYNALFRFHKMYSVGLLYCAKKRLERAT